MWNMKSHVIYSVWHRHWPFIKLSQLWIKVPLLDFIVLQLVNVFERLCASLRISFLNWASNARKSYKSRTNSFRQLQYMGTKRHWYWRLLRSCDWTFCHICHVERVTGPYNFWQHSKCISHQILGSRLCTLRVRNQWQILPVFLETPVLYLV